MKLWQPNQSLDNGRFIIQKFIARGGYGATYSAIELHTKKLVVIKTLNLEQQSKPDFPQQQVKFVNEGLRLAQCSHPNVVKVHELIQEDGLWGMVMEYIDGQDLGSYISEHGQLPEDEALQYITQVGRALEYVHSKGFLHRDVKPNNILLRAATKEAVLIDFGLTREYSIGQLGSMTNAKTDGYAPIEQYERKGEFAPYTDVYALAATLYSLLTQEIPCPANFRQTGIPLPPPKQFNGKISDRVNDAILAGMALEPSRRPQTVREWLELLSNSSSSKIPTKSFEFEYATLTVVKSGFFGREKTCKITRHRGQAEFFTEDLGDGIVLEMVKIPGGKFTMGSPENEEQSLDFERPQHQITIPSFFIGKFAITQQQYQAITGKNPSCFSGAKRPVEKVSWHDAVNFCAKISQKTGKNYRLPSESEWEYACRAGTVTPFHFGETITTELANYRGNYTYGSAPKGEYREETTNVGSFPANQFGLYDMHGLVWEWCQDNWHDNYNGAPSNGNAWLDNDNYCRLLRGGSWRSYPYDCRSAFRDLSNPDVDPYSFGFRVVCGGAART
ncbi:serine/threonine protein kinase [Calothrix sp. NIES-4071]|nr:serine/threonine protein kinase [Calothrix sp. NIES-4071]BAZ59519.1 serine/threonine protein kinase [Calothrix sp. NIES-4105]